MKPMELLGFGPKREAVKTDQGWKIMVTPPAMTGLPTSSLTLTEDQYRRYQQWKDGGVLVQDALPELSPAEREILLTGIGDADFHRITADPDEK